jgi:predicted Zn-dependent protease
MILLPVAAFALAALPARAQSAAGTAPRAATKAATPAANAAATAAQKAALAQQAQAKQAQALFDQAVAAMRAQQLDTALALFRQVAQKFPNAPSYVNIGLIYRQKNDAANAESNLKKALALEPGNVSALQTLSNIYIEQKRWTAAAPLLRRAVARNPADATMRRSTRSESRPVMGENTAMISGWEIIMIPAVSASNP